MKDLFRVDPDKEPEMLAIFQHGGHSYGMDSLLIQEIVEQDSLTRIYNAEDYVAGILNLRGKIVTVVDLGLRLNQASSDPPASRPVLVVPYGNEKLGLQVDQIKDVVSINPEDIRPLPSNVDPLLARFFRGILRRDGQMITLLNPIRVLLPNQEFQESP